MGRGRCTAGPGRPGRRAHRGRPARAEELGPGRHHACSSEQRLSFEPVAGVEFFRTRRSLRPAAASDARCRRARLEPAVLLFAAHEPATRTGSGRTRRHGAAAADHPASLLEWARIACARSGGRLRSASSAPTSRAVAVAWPRSTSCGCAARRAGERRAARRRAGTASGRSPVHRLRVGPPGRSRPRAARSTAGSTSTSGTTSEDVQRHRGLTTADAHRHPVHGPELRHEPLGAGRATCVALGVPPPGLLHCAVGAQVVARAATSSTRRRGGGGSEAAVGEDREGRAVRGRWRSRSTSTESTCSRRPRGLGEHLAARRDDLAVTAHLVPGVRAGGVALHDDALVLDRPGPGRAASSGPRARPARPPARRTAPRRPRAAAGRAPGSAGRSRSTARRVTDPPVARGDLGDDDVGRRPP